MSLQVVISEHQYPRKRSEYSVWVVEAEKQLDEVISAYAIMMADEHDIDRIFCASSVTDKLTAKIRAQAFRVFLQHGGEEIIRKAIAEERAA
jgi:hypothetical protein